MMHRMRVGSILVGALVGASVVHAQARVDVLIRGGTLIDGTGAPGRRADIGVRGDRIQFVGDAASTRLTAVRTIDATGLIVSPGFIDPHTHTYPDLSSADLTRRTNAAYLAQGVTTVLTGNDGGGPVDVAASLARWRRNGIGTNAALYIGFGSMRQRVMGMSGGAANAAQVDQMREMVRQAMAAGAIGMSTGLYYAPQSYASTEEVIAVARNLGSLGGVYDTHLRDESSYSIGLLGAIAEALRIGRETGAAVNISHIKALGVDVWGTSDSAIALIRRARSEGQRVTADQYPYTASGTSVGAALLPRWAEVGGRDSLQARLSNASMRSRIVAEMTENLRRRGGAESILITDRGEDGLLGKRLNALATAKGVSPIEEALAIVQRGDAAVASFNMNEDDISTFMRAEFTMTGSDGSDGHPRKYGTFPRKYRRYVKEKGVLTLPEFVHRSSQMPAVAFGLGSRGVVRTGAYADLVVIDTSAFADRSTYEAPRLLAAGVRFALVNGVMAIDAGRVTSNLGGRPVVRERN